MPHCELLCGGSSSTNSRGGAAVNYKAHAFVAWLYSTQDRYRPPWRAIIEIQRT